MFDLGQSRISQILHRIAPLVIGLLILRVTVAVLANYPDYIPPNFDSDFLSGREGYFWKGYHWAFYAHLISGPPTLVFGLVLMSEQFRRRYPKGHAFLGRIQVFLVVLVLTPSGLGMAPNAFTGAVAGVGFSCLALATAFTIIAGWRAAVRRRFQDHRRWMTRCFLLLCSAVVIRMIGGLQTVIDFPGEWPYFVGAWISWLGPLAVFEFISISRTFRHRPRSILVEAAS